VTTFSISYPRLMRSRKWTDGQLRLAILNSKSIRQVLFKLRLKAAGGNYTQINKYIKTNSLDITHFTGKVWNKGLTGIGKPRITLQAILVLDSYFQSYKLKKRLFAENLKKELCEECGWAQKSEDGRIPLELDHINGNGRDNRLENLRVLCPNCHSLKLTHRGRNIHKIKV